MAEQETNFWQKISSISGLIAAIVIPITLAIVGNEYTEAIKEREIQGRYVELALSILKEPLNCDNRNVRAWAAKVINEYSGVPLDEAAMKEIESVPLLAAPIALFNNGNKELVFNEPKEPTRFTVSQAYLITQVTTYHWNNGQGSTPGTIGLRHENGAMFGPWEAGASFGQGGATNVNWVIRPNVRIPAGAYTVIDSEPETWSYNEESGGSGFAFIEGHPISGKCD